MDRHPPVPSVPTQQFDVDQSERYLRLVWPEIPSGAHITVWTSSNKTSFWYPSIQAYEKDARVRATAWARTNVYYGVSCSGLDEIIGQDLTQHNRVTIKSAGACSEMAFDIDVDQPDNPKPGACPDRETILERLATLPHHPTTTVDSGHGLQAHWLFKKPWLFDSSEDRERYREMILSWRDEIQEAFSPYKLDATFDLARLMRLPGGTNWKHVDLPVPVLWDEAVVGRRYDPQIFLDRMKPTEPGEAPAQQGQKKAATPPPYSGPLILRPDATPPRRKLLALLENDFKFSQTWDRSRPDLPDRTQSGYDMALAHVMVQAGWTDQETANGLIAHRRHHGGPEKLRADYYAMTISKARASEGPPPVSSHARPQTAHDAPKTEVQGTGQVEHPYRAQARKSHPGEPAPPGEPPWWWEPGLGLPLDDAPPARAWTDRRFLWPSQLIFPHGLRWVLPGPQHQGAGSIAAITARPSEWEKAFPEEPRPSGGHMIAIDDAGCGSKHAPHHAGARATDPHSAPGVLIIGNPRPAEAWDPVHIVASMADGLAVACRYPGPVVVCIGAAGMLAPDMGLAEWLAKFSCGAIIHADLDPAGQTAARTLRRDILLAGGKAQARFAPGGLKNPAAAAAAGAPLPSIPPDWSYAETLAETTDWPHWERLRQAFLAWYNPSETAGADKKE